MKKQWQNEFPNRDEFEKLVAGSLKLDNLTYLSSDEEFLTKLNRRLQSVPDLYAPPAKQKPQYIWVNGIWNGVVAMALGIVLLAGLDFMPPLFVNASINGADFVQEKVIQITIEQQVQWQQILVNLENFVQSK